MDVIRPGCPPYLRKKPVVTYQFQCPNCGCIFRANEFEVEDNSTYLYVYGMKQPVKFEHKISCRCPDCSMVLEQNQIGGSAK